jgi:hypothetical protein
MVQLAHETVAPVIVICVPAGGMPVMNVDQPVPESWYDSLIDPDICDWFDSQTD